MPATMSSRRFNRTRRVLAQKPALDVPRACSGSAADGLFLETGQGRVEPTLFGGKA